MPTSNTQPKGAAFPSNPVDEVYKMAASDFTRQLVNAGKLDRSKPEAKELWSLAMQIFRHRSNLRKYRQETGPRKPGVLAVDSTRTEVILAVTELLTFHQQKGVEGMKTAIDTYKKEIAEHKKTSPKPEQPANPAQPKAVVQPAQPARAIPVRMAASPTPMPNKVTGAVAGAENSLSYGFVKKQRPDLPDSVLNKRVEGRSGSGCLWESVLRTNHCFYTEDQQIILAAMTHGIPELQSDYMIDRARDIARGRGDVTGLNTVPGAVIIPFIPPDLDPAAETDQVVHKVGDVKESRIPKYVKPLHRPAQTRPPAQFQSQEDKAFWDKCVADVKVDNAKKNAENFYQLAYGLYRPENKPFLAEFQRNPETWEQMKREMRQRLEKEGLPGDAVEAAIGEVCRKYVWWDAGFSKDESLYEKGQPFRKVLIIEGEFKALAAAQTNLESVMALARQSVSKKTPVSSLPPPTLFEVGGTSGVNGSYISLNSDKCNYVPLHTYTKTFKLEDAAELFFCPDGDGGRWDTYTVASGEGYGTKMEQPGNIGVLHGTLAAAHAYSTAFPHLQCHCVDLADLESKHGIKGLDEVYRAAGPAKLLEAISGAKRITNTQVTYRELQVLLVATSKAGDRTINGFDLISSGRRSQTASAPKPVAQPQEKPQASATQLEIEL